MVLDSKKDNKYLFLRTSMKDFQASSPPEEHPALLEEYFFIFSDAAQFGSNLNPQDGLKNFKMGFSSRTAIPNEKPCRC
jgi:hypothetical protein